ncbi:MAG: hypothetical protein LBH65_06295 [Desulfovibrio sp.]|jgi:hypothetical protein|nr:hypothetical protein [Desulfovibrio sp.]
MKRNVALSLFLILILCLSMGCKRTIPIPEITNGSVSSYGKPSAAQVRDGIMRAGSIIGWQMVEERPGLIVATWRARDHSVIVEIPYSTTQYSIKYRSSVNLLAEGGQIHRNYARWVDRLNRNISKELSQSRR